MQIHNQVKLLLYLILTKRDPAISLLKYQLILYLAQLAFEAVTDHKHGCLLHL